MAHIEPNVKWRNKGNKVKLNNKEKMKIKKKWEGSKQKEFGGISGWDKWVDKKEKKKKERRRGENRKRRRESEKKKRKRGFRFSLRSTKIGSLVFVGVRDKVHLHDGSYTWVPKSGSSSNSKR